MRKMLFGAVVIACLLTATMAVAAPRVDKATGAGLLQYDLDPDGLIRVEFNAFEQWGSPGDPDYRPVKGWVKISGLDWKPDRNGIWPVTDVHVYDDSHFEVYFDTDSESLWIGNAYDNGEPGWRLDTWFGNGITQGNFQVHNYPDDSD